MANGMVRRSASPRLIRPFSGFATSSSRCIESVPALTPRVPDNPGAGAFPYRVEVWIVAASRKLNLSKIRSELICILSNASLVNSSSANLSLSFVLVN
jgi:hypothetical protein